MSSPAGVRVRDMRPEDVPQVALIDRLSFTLFWSEASFLAEASQVTGYYRVAVSGDEEERLLGFLGSHLVEDEGQITTFAVHPDLRRQGIGDRLLADFLREAVSRQVRRVTLEVRESNTPAQRLYRKWGFQPVSRRKRYYSDNEEDALVLWIEDATRASFLAQLSDRFQELER